MTGIRCAQVSELAPELALGLLTGEDRAACLAHLETCGPCRAEVSTLAVTADEVLLAGPRAMPPPGFERRVLARLADERATAGDRHAPSDHPVAADRPTPGQRRRRPVVRELGPPRRRRLLVAAVAAVALVAAALGGLGALGVLGGGDGPAPLAEAEMRTASGRLVGTTTVLGDDPAVVSVELPGWPDLVERYGDPDGTYWLAVELDDGSRTLDRMSGGGTRWETTLEAGADDVAAVSVVDGRGRAWCSGRPA